MIVLEDGTCVFSRRGWAQSREYVTLFVDGAAEDVPRNFEVVSIFKPAIPTNPSCAAILPNNELAFGYRDGSVFVARGFGSVEQLIKPKDSAVVSIGSSRNTNMVIAWQNGRAEVRPLVPDDGQVKVVNLTTGIRSLVCSETFSEPSYFALAGEDGRIHLFNYRGKRLSVLDCGNDIAFLSSSRGGSLTAVAGSELLHWSIDLSDKGSGSYLRFIWPITADLNQISVLGEVPVQRTRHYDEIDSYVVIGFRDGRLLQYRVGDSDEERHRALTRLEKISG